MAKVSGNCIPATMQAHLPPVIPFLICWSILRPCPSAGDSPTLIALLACQLEHTEAVQKPRTLDLPYRNLTTSLCVLCVVPTTTGIYKRQWLSGHRCPSRPYSGGQICPSSSATSSNNPAPPNQRWPRSSSRNCTRSVGPCPCDTGYTSARVSWPPLLIAEPINWGAEKLRWITKVLSSWLRCKVRAVHDNKRTESLLAIWKWHMTTMVKVT